MLLLTASVKFQVGRSTILNLIGIWKSFCSFHTPGTKGDIRRQNNDNRVQLAGIETTGYIQNTIKRKLPNWGIKT
jgi:hypothetical protein